jgi:hypothetical protein
MWEVRENVGAVCVYPFGIRLALPSVMYDYEYESMNG